MKWRFKLCTVTGIDVYLHLTFLLFVLWLGWSAYGASHNLIVMLSRLLLIATIFGIVVLHELGHALAARRYGIGTLDIVLYPIGGVARLERMPDDPRQELVVAIAGPVVNVVLALLALGGILLLGQVERMYDISWDSGILVWLLAANLFLVVFNMLPAFPMDGGRVLRALLAMAMPYARATSIAATIGQIMAVIFFILGLYTNPFLMLIAVVVWFGAADESALAQMRAALRGIPISQAMITRFQTLHPDDPLSIPVQHILLGVQHDFPVVEDGRILGIVTRAGLLQALETHGRDGHVRDALQREFEIARPEESLDQVFTRLQLTNSPAIFVLDNNRLVGVVTMENIGEFIRVQSAIKRVN